MSDATTTTTTGTATSNRSHNGELVLYDIAFTKPYALSTSAPNPWKSRYALNLKRAPYVTEWVSMLDIAHVRQSLGIPAGRKFADGTDFYTLPILVDTSTGTKLGDSFDIAAWLEEKYPGSPDGEVYELFPEQKLPFKCPGLPEEVLVPLSKRGDEGCHVRQEYARFQVNVDMVFSFHAQLMAGGMRWDPEVEPAVRKEFLRRTGMATWEELQVDGEAREALMQKFEAALGGLAEMWGEGPYLLGERPSYADLIVGGWLKMCSANLRKEEWERMRGWHGGVFGRLHHALQEKYAEVK